MLARISPVAVVKGASIRARYEVCDLGQGTTEVGVVGLPVAPVMVYGDDVTHVVTEEGIAYLYRARNQEERREALAAVAGVSPIGRGHDRRKEERLRKEGLVAFPEDLRVRRADAKRSLLAAHSIGDLVEWSGGLYKPPDWFWSP